MVGLQPHSPALTATLMVLCMLLLYIAPLSFTYMQIYNKTYSDNIGVQ